MILNERRGTKPMTLSLEGKVEASLLDYVMQQHDPLLLFGEQLQEPWHQTH